MSSPSVNPVPDVSGYVDLRLFDLSDQEMIDTAIAATKLNLPGWVPREGNTEVVIFEGVALENAEAIVAINRVPGAVVAAILLLAGVERDFGAAPIASAEFTFGDTLGHTIPPGTRLYLVLDDGTSVAFLVEPPGLTVAPGSSTGTVSIIGDTFTASANGIASGTTLIMADPIPSVESVELASAVADGRDPEDDLTWLNRGTARLARLSSALVLLAHFESAALERPEVTRAVAIDLYDPSQAGNPGDHPGHVAVAVLGENGAALSTEAKDAIEQDMEARAVAILDVHVMDVTVVEIDVAANVVPLPGFAWATVQANVVAAIEAYLDPLTWTGSNIVYFTEMISLIDHVEGVDRVVWVTIQGLGADYTMTGVAPLPEADVISISQGP